MKEKEGSKSYNVLNHPDIKTSYANESHILVGDSDVHLFFSTRMPGETPEGWHPDQKIIISHSVFMKMIEFWATRYQLLYTIYGERVKSINDFPSEVVDAAFSAMYNEVGAPSSNIDENITSSEKEVPSD